MTQTLRDHGFSTGSPSFEEEYSGVQPADSGVYLEPAGSGVYLEPVDSGVCLLTAACTLSRLTAAFSLLTAAYHMGRAGD